MKNWQHLRFDSLLLPQLQVLNCIAEGLQLAADACGGFCGGGYGRGQMRRGTAISHGPASTDAASTSCNASACA